MVPLTEFHHVSNWLSGTGRLSNTSKNVSAVTDPGPRLFSTSVIALSRSSCTNNFTRPDSNLSMRGYEVLDMASS